MCYFSHCNGNANNIFNARITYTLTFQVINCHKHVRAHHEELAKASEILLSGARRRFVLYPRRKSFPPRVETS